MPLQILPLISFVLLAGTLLLRIIYLRKNGIQLSSNTGNQKNSIKYYMPVFGLIFLIWLFEMVRIAFQFSFSVLPNLFIEFLFTSHFIGLTGNILLLFSLIIWSVTLLHFKNSLRFGLDEKNRGKLITNGVFSFSRNPFFLSLDIYFIAVVLILPNLFFILFALSAIVSIHLFILKEEHFMNDNYGKEYLDYKRKTRRYL